MGVALHATRRAPYRPVLRHRRLRLPRSWPRLNVLHLSDLHLRRSDVNLFRAEVQAVSRLPAQPDLVCVTGDLCERIEDASLVVQLLRELRPRLGVYLVLGNHEYNAGRPSDFKGGEFLERIFDVAYHDVISRGAHEAEAIVGFLRQAGLTLLRNEGLGLHADGRRLWLAGLDSAWAGRADAASALCGRDENDGVLAMVHEPELAFTAVEHGADLVLAGHTHGGQVRLPLIGAPYTHRLDRRIQIAAGIQPIGRSLLHISAGLGQLLPLRFGCPPELVWLECEPAA
jgi:uncharacterized protein